MRLLMLNRSIWKRVPRFLHSLACQVWLKQPSSSQFSLFVRVIKQIKEPIRLQRGKTNLKLLSSKCQIIWVQKLEKVRSEPKTDTPKSDSNWQSITTTWVIHQTSTPMWLMKKKCMHRCCSESSSKIKPRQSLLAWMMDQVQVQSAIYRRLASNR